MITKEQVGGIAMTDRLKRINELAAKAKTQGLTPEEIEERNRLRKEYLAAFRANVELQLENTYVQEPDGTQHKLPKKSK
jgi:uncharacterized protein YnzC (UPF0291/DUF896 family)